MQKLIFSSLIALISCVFGPTDAFSQTLAEPNKAIPILNFEEASKLWETPSDTTYVVNFWATWCGPCIKELPHFEKLRSEYANQNVKVILVSLDFRRNYESALIPFVKKRNIQSKVVFLSEPDANEWVPRVSPDWSGAIPATLFVNGKTGARAFYEKAFNYEELHTALKQINRTK